MKYWNASQQQRFMDGAHALGVMVLFNLEDVGTRGSGERITHVTRYNNTRAVRYLATMPADGLRSHDGYAAIAHVWTPGSQP